MQESRFSKNLKFRVCRDLIQKIGGKLVCCLLASLFLLSVACKRNDENASISPSVDIISTEYQENSNQKRTPAVIVLTPIPDEEKSYFLLHPTNEQLAKLELLAGDFEDRLHLTTDGTDDAFAHAELGTIDIVRFFAGDFSQMNSNSILLGDNKSALFYMSNFINGFIVRIGYIGMYIQEGEGEKSAIINPEFYKIFEGSLLK